MYVMSSISIFSLTKEEENTKPKLDYILYSLYSLFSLRFKRKRSSNPLFLVWFLEFILICFEKCSSNFVK